MRRNDRARDRSFAYHTIDSCTHGVMALDTGEDFPYCLPLSFVREGDTLYFHCALEGRKLALLERCPRVCITFVSQDQPAMEGACNYTTYFRSAIVTGAARQVTASEEKVHALRLLCEKLLPQYMEPQRFQAAMASLPSTGVWQIQIQEISGKEKCPKPDPASSDWQTAQLPDVDRPKG